MLANTIRLTVEAPKPEPKSPKSNLEPPKSKLASPKSKLVPSLQNQTSSPQTSPPSTHRDYKTNSTDPAPPQSQTTQHTPSP